MRAFESNRIISHFKESSKSIISEIKMEILRLAMLVQELWMFFIFTKTPDSGASTLKIHLNVPILKFDFAVQNIKPANVTMRTIPGQVGTMMSGTKRTKGSGCLADRSSKCLSPMATVQHVPTLRNLRFESDQLDPGVYLKFEFDTLKSTDFFQFIPTNHVGVLKRPDPSPDPYWLRLLQRRTRCERVRHE